MPTRQRKTRTLTFKECRFSKDGNPPLQQLLDQAFRRHPTAVSRFFATTPAGETFHFFNLHLHHRGAICGNFASYTAGHNQPIMALDGTADHLPVAQIEAGQLHGKRAEFLEGLLFFAVFGNGVVLLQTNLLKADQVARYLRWWLRDTLHLLHEEDHISLDDPIPINLKRRRVKSVKRIDIKRNIDLHVRPVSGRATFVADPDRETKTLLQLFAPRLLRDLQLHQAIAPDSITAKVSFEWKGRPPGEGTPMLDEMARELPDSDDDFEIQLTDGTKLRRDQLKKSKDVSLIHEGSIPVFDMLFDKMAEWHSELQQSPHL